MKSTTDPASPPTHTSTGIPVTVRRSARRKRTVSASFRDGAALVLIPGHFTAAQEATWVQRMIEKLEASGKKAGGGANRTPQEGELLGRALKLSAQYLPAAPEPASVRWVSNQSTRWGSATPARKTIRLSDQLHGMPSWVIDYVILHELAHLLVPSHGKDFWDLLSAYPELERAKAFLDGAAFAASRGLDRQDFPDPSPPEASPPEESSSEES